MEVILLDLLGHLLRYDLINPVKMYVRTYVRTLDHMQIIYTSLQSDNYASTSTLMG